MFSNLIWDSFFFFFSLYVVDFDHSDGQWALDHIRGTRSEFLNEIEQSGFELIEEPDLGLEENYCMVFIKKDPLYTD